MMREGALISVIGIGKGSKRFIDEIPDWNSPLVSAIMLDREFIIPGAGAEVAILIITENVDATILAKNLKQSGLLTIIVATCEIRAMEGSYDSMAMVAEDKVMETVKTFTEILTKPSRYICLDLNDLICVMKDSGTFKTFYHKAYIEKGGMTNLANYLQEKLNELNSPKKLLIHISYSREAKEFIKIEDLNGLQDLFSTLSDSIKILWALDADEDLAREEVAISVIAINPGQTNMPGV